MSPLNYTAATFHALFQRACSRYVLLSNALRSQMVVLMLCYAPSQAALYSWHPGHRPRLFLTYSYSYSWLTGRALFLTSWAQASPKPPPSSFSTSSSMQVFCKPFWLRPQNDLHPLCGSFVQVCVFPLCASFVQMSCILCAFISPSACLIFNPCILCAFIPPSVCLNF